ncbi:MAG: tryptophan synthase subunit alpha [Candidatus Promineifilaceae bacterium]|nr:tryptophan synthase subunit alpha [Candidatus Promineifilaceae bacterium]
MGQQNGIGRIRAAFRQAQGAGRAALMPYYTLGYPDRESSLAIVEAIAPYSDLIELGVPFSDPLADGPTIQHSTQRSLEAGTTVVGCLEMVRTLRSRGVTTPFMMMGYYNPVLAYGQDAYAADMAAAGADGFIIPDLPVEEAEELGRLARDAGLALIHFLAPTSNPQRVASVVERAQGFIYMVSLTGITDSAAGPASGLPELVAAVREQASVPVAVGFGIKTPAQAAAVGAYADGVIVGSALIRAVESAAERAAMPETAAAFVRALREGLEEPAAA